MSTSPTADPDMEHESKPDEDLFVIDSGNDVESTIITGPSEPDDEESWKDADFLSFGTTDKATTTTTTTSGANQKGHRAKGGDAAAENDGGGDSTRTAHHGGGSASPAASFGTSGEITIPIVSSFTSVVPPWMSCHPNERYRGRPIAPLVALHNEIIEFAHLVMPQDYEIEARDELVAKVQQIAEKTFGSANIDVSVFGSQATKLFLPTSDIDMVVNFLKKTPKSGGEEDDAADDNNDDAETAKAREHREMEEWDVGAHGSPLRRLADALLDAWKGDLTYLEVLENTRIPIVKFRHGPSNLSVDVSFDLETGPQAVKIMERFVRQMPPLRPLIFVLKYFMKIRDLNEPYTGGMGSFMLQMMIVSFLQHRAREEYSNHKRSLAMNLGSLLLEFFELYGVDFNYYTTGISVREDGSYFPKGATDKRPYFFQGNRPTSLAIENPLDHTADVGRSTFRIGQIQRSFEVAFRVLLAHVSQPYVPAVSILASVCPPTEELHKRAVLIRAARVSADDDHDDSRSAATKGSNNNRGRSGGKRSRSNSSSSRKRGRRGKKKNKAHVF